MSETVQQKIIFSQKEMQTQLTYWLDKLAAEIRPLELPVDKRNFDLLNLQRKSRTIQIPEALTARLLAISQNSDLNLYTLLLAGLQGFLFRITQAEDSLIGSPLLNQIKGARQYNRLVIIRQSLDFTQTLKEIVISSKKSLLAAYENQDYPLEMILEHLGLVPAECLPELSKVILVLKNLHTLTEVTDYPTQLLFVFNRVDTELTGQLIYAADLFQQETIEGLLQSYLLFLEAGAADLDQQIGELPILTAGDKEKLIYTFNHTQAEYPDQKTIPQLFTEQAARTPEKMALSYGENVVTYRQLNQRANRLARRLKQSGIQSGEIIGLLMERSIEMVISILGVIKAGGAYLPLDRSYPTERITYLLQDSQIKILLTTGEVVAEELFAGTILYVDAQELLQEEGIDVELISSPADLLYVIYTSGSTGQPKGVLVEQRNLVQLLFNQRMQFDFNSEDVWTLFHSYCFDFSVWEMYGALLYGGSLVIISKQMTQSPADYLELLKREGVTVLNQTPTAFYQLAEEELKTTDQRLQIRYVIFGGEALKPILLQDWLKKYPNTRLINMYGITETTIHVTYKEITEKEIISNQCNIGRPIPTLTTYIMDARLNFLPVGVAGELCVGGAGVARGYLNRPELTAEKFVENPHLPGERLYRSGDLARWLPNGELEYLGRLDQQVKIRGFRIELGEIENQLLRQPEIKEVIVLADKENLMAYLVTDRELSILELRASLSKVLPEYMIPAYFVCLDQLPLTANGKVDRKALPDARVDLKTGVEYLAPTTELQRSMVKIWSETLEIKEIGIRDNFFHLGGDSIVAIQLISQLRTRLNCPLKITDLYIHQTIEELAALIERIPAGIAETEARKRADQQITALKEKILADDHWASLLPAEYEDFYPMSDIEQGMFFYTLKTPEQALYHDQFVYQLKDESFELERLKQALTLLVDKHEILRTSFHLVDFPEPIQIVHHRIQLPVNWIDLSRLKRKEQEQYLAHYLIQDRANPFEITQAPLWRTVLCRLDRETICLVWIVHHGIMDGWSLTAFLTELFKTYQRLAENPAYRPTALQASYKDMVSEQLREKDNPEAVIYWKNELTEYKRLQLPVSSTTLNNSDQNQAYHRVLEEPLFEQLKQVTIREQITIKDLCFAAYIYMLNLISYEEDFVVGLVTHTRPLLLEGDRLLGCFLNTVPVRVRLATVGSWADLLKWVSAKLTTLKFYERIPLREIVNWLGESIEGENPFFDTIFNFVDFHLYGEAEQLQRMNREHSLLVKDYANTNTYLDVTVSTTLNQLKISFNYRERLFVPAQIEQLVDYFVAVLDAFICEPDGRADKHQLFSAEEKQQLIQQFNQTQVDYPRELSPIQLFRRQAEETPEEVAVVYQGDFLSYRQLWQKVKELAMLLAEKGIRAGEIVGFISERSLEMVVGILGILEAGAVFLPIDPAFPPERITYMLADSGARALLREKFTEIELFNPGFLDPELVYVIYTSGSTGKPKGVGISHTSLLNYVYWFTRTNQIDSTDSSVFLSSFAFDLGYTAFWATLLTGGSLHIIPDVLAKDPEGLIAYLGQHGINFIKTTPSFFNLLVHSSDFVTNPVLQTLRLIVLGGEAIRVQDLQCYQKEYPEIKFINHYGPTECTIGCISRVIEPGELDDFAARPVIGTPNHNLRAYILDARERLLPIGVMGELWIAGAGLAKGYLNRPDLTNDRFVRHPWFLEERMYRTGDLARRLADGSIEFCGRIDRQVKVRGYRVELAEIEEQLLAEQEVTEAIVVAKVDLQKGTYLCGYFTAEQEVDLLNLRHSLVKRLPEYMIPAYLFRLSELPLTPNGKIDYRQLPEIQQDLDTNTEHLPPRTEIEEILVQVWSEVLGISEIGIGDNFFLLGGDSIKAIQIISRTLRYQLKLSLKDLFAYPTIAELAPLVKQARRAEQGPVMGEVELTPIQHYFFEQTRTDRHHYNHSVLIYSQEGFDQAIVEQVFTRIVEHHDALRMVFQQAGDRIRQINRGLEGDLYELKVFECQATDKEFVDSTATRLQESIDLLNGPIVKLGLFKTPVGDHLLIIVHHLVMDGIGWRILFEDFAAGYLQALQGEAIKFPQKTDSFKEWANTLVSYAQSGEIFREIKYWQRIEQTEVRSLPVDQQIVEDRLSDAQSIQISLSVEDTRRLLQETNQVYHTQINDILLTALGLAVRDWSGLEKIAVALEGHGREEISAEINISRTIGWFTTVYPVILDSSHTSDMAYQIKKVKENLRQIPGKGVGYGVLKYLTGKEANPAINFGLYPEVCFNYLGQFDQELRESSTVFSISNFPSGQARSLCSERKYLLDIIGMIREDQLTVSFGYNRYQYETATIHRLAGCFQNNLERIIRHCSTAEQELTPSDVGYQQMSLEDFAYVSSVLDSLDEDKEEDQ